MLNKVILVGRLAADPDVKATPKGLHVAKLRIATNTYGGKDEAGNAKEITEFHNLVVFGRQAEIAGEYLRKGRLVCADGRLQTSSWEDSSGQKHRTTEVVVDNLHLLGRREPEEAA
jgi:single-strand DNA-binding protein